MEGAADEIFPPQERPRTGGLRGDTTRTRPFPQSSSYNSFTTGDQFNAPGGTQNISNGSGNQFPGATFQQPVYFKMDSRFHDIDTAARGTCEWLFRHEMYTSWAFCDQALLWVKGKPGSGKSTLLQYALKNIIKKTNTEERALILSFFFHGRGTELQRTPLGLFQSLLHQLLRQVPEALPDVVATFQERCETVGKAGEKWQWHPRELPRLFESSLPKVLETRPVWLFLDALDECGQKNAVKLVREFKSLLRGLPSTGLQFHICFTCRHYPILDQSCQFEICVEDENRQDISTYVRAQLSVSYELTASTIPDLITKHAQGVFIWAYLVVEQILDLDNKGAGLKKIEDEIYSIPPDLDDLYHNLIRNVDERPASLKLVQWICFAVRPLSLDELQWAMIVDADCQHKSLLECKSMKDYISDSDRMKRRVQTLSRGLAEVTSDTKVVQFIHQSVKDFFVEKGLSALGESVKTDFVVGIAHHRLSRTCIRYLAMEEIGQLASHEPYHLKSKFPFIHYDPDLRSKFPFLHYATTSWVAHTKQSDARNVPQEDLMEYFAGPSNTLVERWVRVYGILQQNSGDCPPEGTTLVHIVSSYGVAGALGVILERVDQVGINIDAKDSRGRTPLWWAAENGHEAVVRLLLDGGAHTEAADKGGRTPLSLAAARGHAAVVRLLLDGGAHTEAADQWGQTPLSYAAARGHEAVVRLLLDGGAYTEAVDKIWGQTLLSWAAETGTRPLCGCSSTGAPTPRRRTAGAGRRYRGPPGTGTRPSCGCSSMGAPTPRRRTGGTAGRRYGGPPRMGTRRSCGCSSTGAPTPRRRTGRAGRRYRGPPGTGTRPSSVCCKTILLNLCRLPCFDLHPTPPPASEPRLYAPLSLALTFILNFLVIKNGCVFSKWLCWASQTRPPLLLSKSYNPSFLKRPLVFSYGLP
ncbi:hypothetical protein BGZ61DRAFT_575021 [Ilyonectria robusta]|uniref:uncharacterized protein n=1 Tax=Ilyonectria robusta TaxID=1079257 RepID=UPI001E8D72E8|nr:uncharacterized protein BGZ61DRAFT_575021 [Ilyonectria robusta]KAH8652944.1 hypothetical protein BGZ61DRAFT_575021 [Ilyonectria robusta]